MTPANITAWQGLLQADPALAQQLQSAATPDSADELLARTARQKGLALNARDIADYRKTAHTIEMSDAKLEAVAGGRTCGVLNPVPAIFNEPPYKRVG